MKNFLKGILFITLLLPIIDGIIEVVKALSDLYCTRIAQKIYAIKKEIEEDMEPEEPLHNAIGFHAPIHRSDEIDEEEDWDE